MSTQQIGADDRLATYLKNHPRMIGILFTLSLLLAKGVPVAAAGNGGTVG